MVVGHLWRYARRDSIMTNMDLMLEIRRLIQKKNNYYGNGIGSRPTAAEQDEEDMYERELKKRGVVGRIYNKLWNESLIA